MAAEKIIEVNFELTLQSYGLAINPDFGLIGRAIEGQFYAP